MTLFTIILQHRILDQLFSSHKHLECRTNKKKSNAISFSFLSTKEYKLINVLLLSFHQGIQTYPRSSPFFPPKNTNLLPSFSFLSTKEYKLINVLLLSFHQGIQTYQRSSTFFPSRSTNLSTFFSFLSTEEYKLTNVKINSLIHIYKRSNFLIH